MTTDNASRVRCVARARRPRCRPALGTDPAASIRSRRSRLSLDGNPFLTHARTTRFSRRRTPTSRSTERFSRIARSFSHLLPSVWQRLCKRFERRARGQPDGGRDPRAQNEPTPTPPCAGSVAPIPRSQRPGRLLQTASRSSAERDIGSSIPPSASTAALTAHPPTRRVAGGRHALTTSSICSSMMSSRSLTKPLSARGRQSRASASHQRSSQEREAGREADARSAAASSPRIPNCNAAGPTLHDVRRM